MNIDVFDVYDEERSVDPIEPIGEIESNKSKKIAINYLPAGNKLIYMTRTGAFVKFTDLDVNNTLKVVRKIENYFTLKAMLFNGKMKQSKRCKVDKPKQRIIIPRFGIFEILNNKFGLEDFSIKCQISTGDKPIKPFKWKKEMSLTDNQNVIAKYLLDNVYNTERIKVGSAGTILNLEAGQGKSYLATYFMYKFQKKTAIILHSTALIDQWVKVLNLCYDNTIGFYYGKKKIDGDIVLLIIDSALSDEFKFKNTLGEIITLNAIDFYKRFGYIIYDECHEYANGSSSKVFKVAQSTYILGLSATPDENAYKFDPIIWWELGPITKADDLLGYKSTKNSFKADIHRIMYYGPPQFTKLLKNEKTGMTSFSSTINMICEDKIRMRLVIECIHKCMKENLYTFVFADRREYLEELRLLLSTEQAAENSLVEIVTDDKNSLVEIVTDDKDFMRIVGGAKSTDLEQAETSARVILTTYAYMGTGKSIVKMNGLVLANPRKNKMKQYINRIFRLGSDSSVKRHVYDIVDMKTMLKNQWSIRKKHYTEKGYTIEEEKYKYQDIAQGTEYISKKDKTPTSKIMKHNKQPVNSEKEKEIAEFMEGYILCGDMEYSKEDTEEIDKFNKYIDKKYPPEKKMSNVSKSILDKLKEQDSDSDLN